MDAMNVMRMQVHVEKRRPICLRKEGGYDIFRLIVACRPRYSSDSTAGESAAAFSSRFSSVTGFFLLGLS